MIGMLRSIIALVKMNMSLGLSLFPATIAPPKTRLTALDNSHPIGRDKHLTHTHTHTERPKYAQSPTIDCTEAGSFPKCFPPPGPLWIWSSVSRCRGCRIASIALEGFVFFCDCALQLRVCQTKTGIPSHWPPSLTAPQTTAYGRQGEREQCLELYTYFAVAKSSKTLFIKLSRRGCTRLPLFVGICVCSCRCHPCACAGAPHRVQKPACPTQRRCTVFGLRP